MLAPELRSLLQGCKDAPDDDLPRFVLADWLDDHGQSDRAEFVRLSVRLAAKEIPRGDEAVALARLHELYSRNAEAWLGGLRQRKVVFVRGLLRVRARLQDVRTLDSIAPPDALPWMETLQFDYVRQQQLRDLLGVAALDHFSGLDLTWVKLTGDVVREVGTAPRAAGLRSLRLTLKGSQTSAAEGLAGCERLTGLRVLSFTGGLGDTALAGLATAPWARGLTTLTMRFVGGIRKGVQALSGTPNAPRLRHLYWQYVHPGASGMSRLTTSGALSDVVDLCLDWAKLTAQDVRSMAQTEWPLLRRLDLRANHLGDEGVKALAAVPMPALRELNLSGTSLTAAGLRELVAAPWAAGLEQLDLGTNTFYDEGAHVLANSAALAGVRRLAVSGCGLGEAGVRALGGGRFKALQTLDVGRNPLDSAGLLALSEGEWPALTALSLEVGKATAEGFRQLTRSPLAHRLRCLELRGYSLAPDEAEALGASHLANLKELHLDHSSCSGPLAEALARGPFSGLVRLSCRALPFGDAFPTLFSTHGFPALAILDLNRGGLSAIAQTALLAWPGLARLARLRVNSSGIDSEVVRHLAEPVAFSVAD